MKVFFKKGKKNPNHKKMKPDSVCDRTIQAVKATMPLKRYHSILQFFRFIPELLIWLSVAVRGVYDIRC